MNTFSIKDCLSTGWRIFKSRPWIFIGAGVLVFALQMLANMVTGFVDYLSPSDTGMDVIASLITLAISITVWGLIGTGTLNFFLKAYDNVTNVSLKDLWAPKYAVRYVLASIVAGVLVLLGLVLLIVPGIILGLAFYFVLYLIIDQDMGVKAALKRSIELTKGHRWHLFVFGLAIAGLNTIGILALFVGLIVTIPMSQLATVHVYRKLTGKIVPVVAEVAITEEPAATAV